MKEDSYDDHRQEREQLNEIRAVGKGSRGGKGARKRRNGGKDSTRRHSAAERERASAKDDGIVRRLKVLFTPADREAAESFLATDFKLAALEEPSIPAFWAAIGLEPRRAFIVDGDALHRQALEYDYSVFVMVATDMGVKMHIRMIREQLEKHIQESDAKKQLRQISSPDDVLRAIIRLTLELGHRQDESYQVWRMAAAIRWFIAKGIPPQGVEKEYRKNGGGLDKWAREAPKTIGAEKREIALEAEALVADSHYSPDDESYYEDVEADRRTAVEPPTIPEYESILLRYCVHTVGLEPGGFLLLGILGDDAAPLKARVVLSNHVEQVGVSPSQIDEDARMLKRLADQLFKRRRPKGPYDEDGWLLPNIW